MYLTRDYTPSDSFHNNMGESYDKYLVEHAQLQGEREYQEDTYFKETIGGVYCAGVFDGHGGGECSRWVVSKCRVLLHTYIRSLYLEDYFTLLTNMITYKRCRKTDAYTRLKRMLEGRPFGNTAEMCLLLYTTDSEQKLHDIRRFLFNWILRQVVQQVTVQWDTHSARLASSGSRENYIHSLSGTTLLLCIITSSDIHITWVGDSRCVYTTDKHTFGFTTDHKPNRNDFVSNKCFILNGRLNGILAVGRTVGDNTPELMGCINRQPSQMTIGYKKKFRVILASDGLYDLVPMDTIIQSPVDILTRYAYHDNMTIISIQKK